jgi:hypothetical protein
MVFLEDVAQFMVNFPYCCLFMTHKKRWSNTNMHPDNHPYQSGFALPQKAFNFGYGFQMVVAC